MMQGIGNILILLQTHLLVLMDGNEQFHGLKAIWGPGDSLFRSRMPKRVKNSVETNEIAFACWAQG